MKNHLIILLVPFSLFLNDLSGQVLDKGNFVIGSTLGFSSANSKVTTSINNEQEEGNGPTAIQVSIAPNVGYFLTDNFVLGIGLDYTSSTLKEPNENRTEDSDLLFGPFARYYLPVADDMSFFFETDFGFGSSSDEQVINEQTQKIQTNVFAIGLGPGFTIFSNSDIGIEALIKYNFAQGKFDTESNGIKTVTTTKTNQLDIFPAIDSHKIF